MASDLVFIQNGMLEPWLAERGLEDNTQVTSFPLLRFCLLKEVPSSGQACTKTQAGIHFSGERSQEGARTVDAPVSPFVSSKLG